MTHHDSPASSSMMLPRNKPIGQIMSHSGNLVYTFRLPWASPPAPRPQQFPMLLWPLASRTWKDVTESRRPLMMAYIGPNHKSSHEMRMRCRGSFRKHASMVSGCCEVGVLARILSATIFYQYRRGSAIIPKGINHAAGMSQKAQTSMEYWRGWHIK